MIEVFDVKVGESITWVCEECEEQFGGKVRFTQKNKPTAKEKAARKRWEHTHDKCGAKDLDDRINSYIPNLDDKIGFCKRLYAENPSIKFAEVQRLWEEQKKGIDT